MSRCIRLLFPLFLLLPLSCDHPRILLFLEPGTGLLGEVGAPVEVVVRFPPESTLEELRLFVDGTQALDTGDFSVSGQTASASLPGLAPGRHDLRAEARVVDEDGPADLDAETWVELVSLERPDDCEVLNQVECVLPFPSSRYLEQADTATGVRVVYPQGIFPGFPFPVDTANFDGQDGFSPGVQVLASFPGGVDPELSGASRLLSSTRSYDTTSLQPESPTLLLDVTAGMTPVLHFIERDARALRGPNPQREITFLRPAETLLPGHHYIVAFRNLKHPDGSDVQAEPAFAVLRDRRPTSIPGVEARRDRMEDVFERLEEAGVAREELVLALDFVVQSDAELTRALVAMRDRALQLVEPPADVTVYPFVVDPEAGENASTENDCTQPDEKTWRVVNGTYGVALFLSGDPLLEPDVRHTLVDDDGDGLPDVQGTMQANFSIQIPCSVLDDEEPLPPPILLGHGLFGNGAGAVGLARALSNVLEAEGLGSFERVGGATDWLGLSSNEFPVFIAGIIFTASEFAALPDRLSQSVVNAGVLARMMREGLFNELPAFRTPDGRGVFRADGDPVDYFGISLGGIMGTITAAASPDLGRIALDVPAANFSILIQRSRAIGLIANFLDLVNDDPMDQAIFFQVGEELWDSAEPVGYLRRLTSNPLPGSGPPKELLYTVARFDGIVSNEASEIAARSLGLVNLEGSATAGLLGIPDVPGPVDPDEEEEFRSVMVYHDLGMYDGADPALLDFVPPLANDIAPRDSECEPHGRTFRTPAAALQITRWLDQGAIENTCDGICDALFPDGTPNPFELSAGDTVPCDPLAPQP